MMKYVTMILDSSELIIEGEKGEINVFVDSYWLSLVDL